MKIFYTFLLLLVAQTSLSQVKVSISDGNWNDPQNWNPAVVPLFNEDSVIVNHEINVMNDLEVGINHLIIGSDGIIDANAVFALHGSLKIDGEIIADTLVVGDGDYCINNGLIEANQFVTTNLMNSNTAHIDILGTFSSVEPFINTSTGTMETMDVITTSDADFENNGTLLCESWLNEGTVLGSGSFCIEECLKNFGNITGTLDVCDLTPNSGIPCDFSTGTVASTVTLCSVGPCTGTSGITDPTLDYSLFVYPNPSNGLISIEFPYEIDQIEIYDLTGRMLLRLEEHSNTIDLSSLQNGHYTLVVHAAGSILKRPILVTQ